MIYTITLISIFIFSFVSKGLPKRKREIFFLVSCFFLLGLLAGFRYEDKYSDFQINYRRMIQVYNMNWHDVIHYSTEFIHQIFRKIISIIFKDPQWYFIISSLFIVGVYMKTARDYTKDHFLFVILYYAVFSYFPANNITRQCIAVAVTLLAWNSLIDNKTVRFILTMVIAILIHNSAIIFAPLYLLSYKKFTRNTLFGYIIVGILIAVFNRPLISFFQMFAYGEYVEGSYGTTASNPLRIVLAIIAGLSMILYVNKSGDDYLQNSEKISNLRYKNFILHGTFMFIMCYVLSTIRMLMFARFALYFAPCAIICIINAIETQRNKQNINYILLRSTILLFAILWFAAMNYAGKLIPTPYTPFWNFPQRAVILMG